MIIRAPQEYHARKIIERSISRKLSGQQTAQPDCFDEGLRETKAAEKFFVMLAVEVMNRFEVERGEVNWLKASRRRSSACSRSFRLIVAGHWTMMFNALHQ